MSESIAIANTADHRDDFLAAMSRLASSVSVVTSDGVAGRVGLTVSAMTSVSADTPRPSLLICLNEAVFATDKILQNGVFCVNVLNQEQHFVSDVFAGRYKEIQDRFECGEWDDGVLGCPRLIEATTSLECEIFNHQKVGSHYVIFGEVAEINFGKNAQSLVYADRSYQVAQPLND